MLTYFYVRCGSALRGATIIRLTKIIVGNSIGLLQVSSGARVYILNMLMFLGAVYIHFVIPNMSGAN